VAALQVFISFQKSNRRCNHVTSADWIWSSLRTFQIYFCILFFF
jgi:hypothetical protein